MSEEAVVKLTSLCGITGGLGVLRGYAHHESLDIYRSLPWADTMRALLLAPYLIVRTVWRCARQRRRWPWDEHADLRAAAVPKRELPQWVECTRSLSALAGHTLAKAPNVA